MFAVDRLPLSVFLQTGANGVESFDRRDDPLLITLVGAMSGKTADVEFRFEGRVTVSFHLTDDDGFVRDDLDDFVRGDIRVADEIRELHDVTFRCLTS